MRKHYHIVLVIFMLLCANRAFTQQAKNSLIRFFPASPAQTLVFNFTKDAQGWSCTPTPKRFMVQGGKFLVHYDELAPMLHTTFDQPQQYPYVEIRCGVNTAAQIELYWCTEKETSFSDDRKLTQPVQQSSKHLVRYEFIIDTKQSVTQLGIKFPGARGIVAIDSVILSQRRVKTDISKDIRDSLRMYPDPSFEHTVTVPSDARMYFACGLRDQRKIHKQMIRFEVFAKIDDTQQSIWNETISGQTKRNETWSEAAVDLSAYAGKEVTFVFSAKPSFNDSDTKIRPVFSVPIIYSVNKSKPNIIVIGVDALRADHLGCYGYPLNTSPTIDALAQRGILFDDVISQCSWTLPSFTSITTGLYPFSHHVEDERDVLAPHIPNIQQYLRDNGYYAVGFTNGGYLTSWLGWDRGFDIFVQNNHFGGGNFSFSFADYKGQLFDFITKNRNCPMYLFLHTYDCHAYYDAAPEEYQKMFTSSDYEDTNNLKAKRFADYYLRRNKESITDADVTQIKGLYDSEIRYLDDLLKQLFALLDELKLTDNTIIVFTSDHGEEFNDHGSFGHNHTLYKELVHVPLIISGPGIEKGKRITQIVESIDIFPTIADMLNLPVTELNLEGQSLMPLINDPHHAGFGPAVSKDWNKIGIRTDAWTYFSIDDSEYLFNRHTDPGEVTNLIDQRQKEASMLKRRLKRITDKTAAPDQSLTGEMDEQAEQELKSLGYIQ